MSYLDFTKILSGVKKYGVLAEYTLEAIIKDLLPANQYIANALYIWSDLNKSNLDAAQTNFNQLDQRFDNIRKIQNVFLNCYFESINTVSLYEELISNSKTDKISRFDITHTISTTVVSISVEIETYIWNYLSMYVNMISKYILKS